jgi:hypothetical protein
MTSELLNVAYSVATEINPGGGGDFDREFALAKDRLARIFTGASQQALEDAYRQARRLIETAAEVADTHRGPKNDFTGLPLEAVEGILRERCPGFSPSVYQAAFTNGLFMTRK